MKFYLALARTLLVCACLACLQLRRGSASPVKTKRDLDTREKVRRLQLQTMLKDLERRDLAAFSDQQQRRAVPMIKRPRAVANTPTLDRRRATATRPAAVDKRGAPCAERRRRRREAESRRRDKRLTRGMLDGEGWVPAHQMTDSICEDEQPVEVVKIQSLVVRNGIIRDSMILEKAMLD